MVGIPLRFVDVGGLDGVVPQEVPLRQGRPLVGRVPLGADEDDRTVVPAVAQLGGGGGAGLDELTRVGLATLRRGLRVGDRVGVPWLGWTCGECRFCRSGRENLCDRARFTGLDIDGGYAELTVADDGPGAKTAGIIVGAVFVPMGLLPLIGMLVGGLNVMGPYAYSRGTVAVLKTWAGREHTLHTLGEGDCFGEMAVISRHGNVRSADVIAETGASIITIRGEALEKASDACRMHFYQGFLDVLTTRLSLSNQRLAAI